MTGAKSSFGVVLNWNGHDIAEITEIGGLKFSSEFKDVTSHSSPARFREKIATVLKAENIPFKANFVSSDTDGQIAMITDGKAQTARTVIITFPTSISVTWTVTAYIANVELVSGGVDGSLEFTGELEVTGEPTFANGASGGLTGLTGIEENGSSTLDLIPNFANGTSLYTAVVNTASSYVKFTPTAASHTITILNDFDASTVTVATGNQSGELDLGAANTVTKFTFTCYESGKTSKVYIVYVTRAAA